MIGELILRLLVALVLGAILGVERTLAHKMAGVRTFALVSLGSALFAIIGEQVGEVYANYAGIDPLRMASQVIAGIGFLGAGLIIFKESKLNGLTTAAGLWVAAGLGLASGFGFYVLALATSFLTLFTFTVLWLLEERIRRPHSILSPESRTESDEHDED